MTTCDCSGVPHCGRCQADDGFKVSTEAEVKVTCRRCGYEVRGQSVAEAVRKYEVREQASR